MLNKVIIIGRLTDSPELRYTPNGNAVCNFTLAVQRNFKNKQEEYDADFIDITIWRKQAENCANYLDKGQMAAVEGRWQQRSYETDNGNKRYVDEVVANNVQFISSKQQNKEDNQQKNKNEEDIEVPF